ncbi:MAG: ATP-binding protein [Methanocellales archaeon]|nr:ATP-binding protein [Methanocellales archaeon]
MKETIKTILYSWVEKRIPDVIPREISLETYLGMRPRKIVVITGFRRVGKTYLLFQLLNKLLSDKDKEQAVYINFDDERIPERTEFLTELLPTIKRTFSKAPELIFLDEVQNIPNWSRWLRRIYDNENLEIFITGSSSKVSSREIPTELRGRCLEVKVFPLSFGEFFRFKNTDIDLKVVRYSESERTKLTRMLDEYLRYGGMPEVVLATEDKKFEILQQYYGTVVRRDIIERFRVKNEEGLKAMVRLLLNSTQYSISRVYDTLKSLNYEIGKTTLLKYLNYVESSYFIHSLPIFSPKVKDQLQYARKVYFIDNGFINTLSTRFSKNIGRVYENIVAIELLRRYSKKDVELYYWKDRRGKEVDFVVKDGIKIRQLIQVCYDVEYYDTRKREINALLRASEELRCKSLLIITGDYEGTEEFRNKRINFIPLWKWLLRKEGK